MNTLIWNPVVYFQQKPQRKRILQSYKHKNAVNITEECGLKDILAVIKTKL